MPNITINIKNCGCGSGSVTPTTGGASGQWTELGDPTSTSGPPQGFFESTSGLSDRQCKMAVWIYDWLFEFLNVLGTEGQGDIILTTIRYLRAEGIPAPLRTALRVPVEYALGIIISALFTGPDITELGTGALVFVVIESILAAWSGINTTFFYTESIQTLIPKIQTVQEDIICAMAQASNGQGAKEALAATLDEAEGFTSDEEFFVLGLIPNLFLTMLFYSADWWPSFDDDYLAGITTTCCGGLVNDSQIDPQSQQACQAGWYIVDMLAQTFQAAYDGTSYVDWNINPFDNESAAIYDRLKTSIETPALVREKAYNYQSFLNAITQIIVPFYTQVGVVFVFLQDFAAIRDYINTNAATLQTALFNAADRDAAYTALQPIRDEINTILAAVPERRDYMLAALDALIALRDDEMGLLDLLFRYDSRLANHALDVCGAGAGDEYYLTAIDSITVYQPNADIQNENDFLGAESNPDGQGGMYVEAQAEQGFAYLEGDFGQVYNDVWRLRVHVRADVGQANNRLLDRIAMEVKENPGDSWQSVGAIYVNQYSYSDGVWQWRYIDFAARPVRYVRLHFIRGVALGLWGWRYFDALKVETLA